MSWSGFKKNVGRATTQVMMKTGHVEKTSDREYEVEERRYRTLESASLRLQKEAKGYLDSLRAMTASQMRIAETIDAFYGDSGASDGVSRSYKQAVEDLDAETVKALDGPYRSVPSDLRGFAWDDERGVEDTEELRKIEWEMNHGMRKTFTGARRVEIDEYGELMDFIYRTTVLEPINRFCAYFPDINECIKKRNHKMLDYDSVRARVRKLTEKPDRDPGKLPRTEKEAEMVRSPDSLRISPASAFVTTLPRRKSVKRHSTASFLTVDSELDLAMPSPPKALNGIRQRLGLAPPDALDDEEPLLVSPPRGRTQEEGSHRASSLLWRCSTLLSPRLGAGPNEAIFQRHESTSPTVQHQQAKRSSTSNMIPRRKVPKTTHPALCDISPPESPSRAKAMRLMEVSSAHSTPRKPSASASTRGGTLARVSSGSIRSSPAPWFEPSELEDIMAPVREEFMRKQADELKQAKAGYEQLNEQLTTELPQLIDLRVPYLDPSFEALVKIQLRFCAEAYSRMAQVQQYLDASTRDQYASGDLDARVEDVLGQIRELSIAGTV
ncbi:BAR adaptor protein Hob3 [Oleoguttula sp. CCFEE 5521]